MTMGENNMSNNQEVRAKWEKKAQRRFTFYMHREFEKDLIDYLESQTNMRQYLINLIRKDMDETTEKTSKEQTDKSEI